MTMHKVLRFGAEASGCIFIGGVISSLLPPSDEYHTRLKHASKPIFEQSHSLTAEYYGIMSKVESLYYGRLRSISQRTGTTSKDIRKGDLDELCKNLTNEDPHVDGISELFEDQMPANHGHIFKIVDKYRLIPPGEEARILKIIGGDDRKKSAMEEILLSVDDIKRLVGDLTGNLMMIVVMIMMMTIMMVMIIMMLRLQHGKGFHNLVCISYVKLINPACKA
jgi:hypothetical protein